MAVSGDTRATIEAALLAGASVRRVIELQLATTEHGVLVVGAKIDLDAELTMREVSVVVHQAKRRVQAAVAERVVVYVEPDVWLDPNVPAPATSAIVTLSYD